MSAHAPNRCFPVRQNSSLPAVVAFVALTAGFLGFPSALAHGQPSDPPGPGAQLLRSALPGALLRGLLGWLISKPLLAEVHIAWVEVTVLAMVTNTMLAGFIGWTAFIVRSQ